MRRIILATLILIMSSIIIYAQDDEPVGWRVEERCLTDPIVPQDGFAFDGVIFTEDIDNIYGMRAGNVSPYLIVADRYFQESASISPDGEWIAILSGGTQRLNESSLNYEYDALYTVEAINVYGTRESADLIQIPWIMSGVNPRRRGVFSPILWLDSARFVYYQTPEGAVDPYRDQTYYEVNLLTGEHTLLEQDFAILKNRSPDGTRAALVRVGHYGVFEVNGDDIEALRTFSLGELNPLGGIKDWFTDSSSFVSQYREGDDETIMLGLWGRDGDLLDTIFIGVDMVTYLSPDDHYLAFWAKFPGDEQLFALYIADMSQKLVYNLCLETRSPWDIQYRFSPTGGQLALNRDGVIQILDLETWENYVIAEHDSRLFAWR
jgi:hypothetical protein